MKKIFFTVFITGVLMVYTAGCNKIRIPMEPVIHTKTATPVLSTLTMTPTATQSQVVSPTISATVTETGTLLPTSSETLTYTVTPTVTETATVTDTGTKLPSATETVTHTVTPSSTETPVIFSVDNFETGIDSWTTAKDGGSLSTVRTGIVRSANPSYGSYALGVTGEAWAEIGSNPYTGFTSMQKTFTTKDLSSYISFDFAAAEKITFSPIGPVSYTAGIMSGANIIVAAMTVPTTTMTNYTIPLSSFSLPSGATGYTVASVLANADGVIFEVAMQPSALDAWVGYELYFDNVEFKQ